MNTVQLRNGVAIPQVGLGTWQLTDREVLINVIASAYQEGYRLIDTAAAYSNEISISKAIEKKGIFRDDLFISDKVWNTNRGYKEVQEACKRSLKKMKTDYFDLYLIHWPASPKIHTNWEELNADTWRGMETLLENGIVRAIGVCNFKRNHLEILKRTAVIMPMINQIEYHPGMNQKETLDYCVQNDICIEASSPLGNGQILLNSVLKNLAEKKGKSVSQICLRWAAQKGIVVLPRTSKQDRLRENISIFDFELSSEEMQTIDNISYCGGIGIDSDEVTEFG